ncbi:hypothetical protein M2475_000800 [Breznakia sp. PF5-3]|uniref:hypothetical protein n=1 Tax=unclassified Breznakia TaxID=2623764 RepID=UPI002405EF02|nr:MULTISPECIES: hypothetical protein [unclassified Breznakia]MDF9824482.1 hypothetical protein [Breznakia sp. PM6-1]MDF9835235.1 hypothetical protein [Breznakia sp. PF5-3]MDF9837437.1 hypothetical protein [Breznakia sp. PFB2-8]MDF9859373.1 hypothetical protein [Breznakia sp. PH5-24]
MFKNTIDLEKLNIFYTAFPMSLKNDVEIVLKKISKTVKNQKNIYLDNYIRYRYLNEDIYIPYRICFSEIPTKKIKKLTSTQKMILFCIYSRHHNGYVREKYINNILDTNFSDWCIPYILKIIDEYVYPIIVQINDKLNIENEERIKKICMQNTNEMCLSFNRMISYWNEFYREQFSNINDYAGFKLFCRIGYNKTIVNEHFEQLHYSKQILDNEIERLKIVIVGRGYIDMITPYSVIKDFINVLNNLNIRIDGFTWWCHAKDEHKACGFGGPPDYDGKGYYSEIQMGSVMELCNEFDVLKCNNTYLNFFLNEYPYRNDYKKCYVPGFWIDIPNSWKNITGNKKTH